MPLLPHASASQVVIVTGGSRGFGAAIVKRFTREGCKVIVLDLEAGDEHNNLHYQKADVTIRASWEEALVFAETTYGRLDIVVNNAGIAFDNALIHTKTMQEYDKTFDVNVRPVFLSAQAIAPFMLQQGHGAFVNITSTGFTRPRAGFAIYNASKAAVAIATKTMALEYAPTIRFNGIAPSVGNTAMLQASLGENETECAEKLEKLMALLPMQRLCGPDDVANAAWFLASEESSFITGTILDVDGGRGV
ncbi:oxidoreductase, short-chain dehydrogenase/reductase family [Sporothrix brasiliensis 5110]|uniref:Oxidoreductase, short-chain dehydrogenase/reductase family n=1 Tax=Sporothrix brasiliensis 5110 TaxID=1398154 RepID=A0A0C2IJ87_9PEZI|nr:oxidoreductase, short-chain dehydrogenase/reductase family [Sporothrix brasiliensis 5110]KIH87035.1 oxidoreductase, short-chain dehydrogenase/reductase family [Sporothrix brasiliensis 5110]